MTTIPERSTFLCSLVRLSFLSLLKQWRIMRLNVKETDKIIKLMVIIKIIQLPFSTEFFSISLSLSIYIYIYICCFTHLHSCLQSFSESTVFSRMILNLPTLEPRGDNCSFFALQSLSESIADFS